MRAVSAHELTRSRHCLVPGCPEMDDVDELGRCRSHRDGRRAPGLRALDEVAEAAAPVLDRAGVSPRRRARRPRARADGGGGVLSPRELLVLRLAAAGKTTPEIAAELEVSRHTVISQRRYVLRKLDAATMAHAVAIATKEGIL